MSYENNKLMNLEDGRLIIEAIDNKINDEITTLNNKKADKTEARVYYGTCSTGASTQQKVVTLVGDAPDELKEGMVFVIKFTTATSYNGKPTLKIGNFPAISVNNGYRYMWNASSTIAFVYINNLFEAQIAGTATTTYYGVTKLTSSTSSTSEALAATAKGVKTAYDQAVKVMVGAGETAGTAGRVPAPAIGDDTKFLKGDGTWETAPGARIIQVTTTVTNTSGSYTTTIQDSRVSADMKALNLEIANPYVFNDKITVTCDTGTVTLSCNDVEGTSDVTINIIKAELNTATLTTEEFDILNADKVSKDELEEALANIGTGVYVVTLDAVTNTSGSYTHTTTVSGMTGDLKCVKLECSNPTIFRAPVSIVTGTDSVTLACSNVAGTSTVKASFLAVGNGNPLNSSEYAALDTRIGSLSDLDTTDKSSVIDAINDTPSVIQNSNGTAYKFPSGVLICVKTITSSISCTLAWGSMYESDVISLGNWAVNFIENPLVFVNPVRASGEIAGWPEIVGSFSTTSAGETRIYRPTAASGSTQLHIMGIGKWK